MTATDTPRLDGVHHLKLPVSDLARSRAWYESRLGYRLHIEFVEDGFLRGVALSHPRGGPELALRLDPDRAAAVAGFDYFSIGVPSEEDMHDLAVRLTALGDEHGGVHRTSIGWILPSTHDPDGHEVRFYTTQRHAGVPSDGVLRTDDLQEVALGRARDRGAGPLARS
ncbi:Catechol 2,3-dioxygenase [Geodermatophilus obscurus]|uniref:Catechol 2,3-dioxygenase n=1 Tax=Geodermatophilus obscurus TaxID=1861 RepID=A0A1M7U021_9ACTN|nr:VOC family protein [Geodermatophilus obscurus]SHN76329.1 Catechol 2,3-dioxygenase [Geodermatophilus obscurus]